LNGILKTKDEGRGVQRQRWQGQLAIVFQPVQLCAVEQVRRCAASPKSLQRAVQRPRLLFEICRCFLTSLVVACLLTRTSAQLEEMAGSYDPNFEFDAPKVSYIFFCGILFSMIAWVRQKTVCLRLCFHVFLASVMARKIAALHMLKLHTDILSRGVWRQRRHLISLDRV